MSSKTFANMKSSCSASASRSVSRIAGALRSVGKLLIKQTSKLRRQLCRVAKNCKLFDKTSSAQDLQHEPMLAEALKIICATCLEELLFGVTDPRADNDVYPTDSVETLEELKFDETENDLVMTEDTSAVIATGDGSCLESKPVADLSPANRFKTERFVAISLRLKKHWKKMIKKAPDCAYYVQRVTPPTCMSLYEEPCKSPEENFSTLDSLELKIASDEHIIMVVSLCLEDLLSEVTSPRLDTPVNESSVDVAGTFEEQKCDETEKGVLLDDTSVSAKFEGLCLETNPEADSATLKNRFNPFVAKTKGLRTKFRKMFQNESDRENAQGDTPPTCTDPSGERKPATASVTRLKIDVAAARRMVIRSLGRLHRVKTNKNG